MRCMKCLSFYKAWRFYPVCNQCSFTNWEQETVNQRQNFQEKWLKYIEENMTTQKDFKFKVGQLVKHMTWDDDQYKEVLCIGNNSVFYRWDSGVEKSDPFSFWDDYVLYTPPKKTIRLYPALIDIGASMNIWRVDWDNLFQNEEEAHRHFGCQFFKWPASESLFVDVPVEEK